MKIYFVASNDQFIKLIIAQLAARGYDVTVSSTFNVQQAGYADVIWCEWADENALMVQDYITTAKKILRVHAYEAYTNIWQQLNPAAFDEVIFVASHIEEQVRKKCRQRMGRTSIISNYTDPSKYTSTEKSNNKIAYAGYVCRKKGFGELVIIANSMPDYEFYVAGTVQDADIDHWLQGGKPVNLHYETWTQDINKFYSDKAYVINTSLREGVSVATIEAMLCGCKPLVRNWEGASDIYPSNCLWNSIQDIQEILTSGVNENYRDYAISHLRLDTVIQQIEDIINRDKPVDSSEMPTLTVGIVQTRKKYMGELINSLKMQDYPLEVVILDNMDKEKSIGQCFNELADKCKTDWIVYVGDDDWLAEDYIESVMKAYVRRKEIYNLSGLITATTAFDDTGKFQIIPHYATGFWKADYVRKYRFDETLVRQVDTEFHKRAQSINDGNLLWITWITGYHYRQHADNISGNKFTEGAKTSQEK